MANNSSGLPMGCVVRLALVGIIGVPVSIGMCCFAGFQTMFGNGSVVVYNAFDTPIEVHMDGELLGKVRPDKARTFSVPQGRHRVRILDEYRLKTTGWTTHLVPTDAAQCFAELEMGYLYEGSYRSSPEVREVYTADTAHDIRSSPDFRIEELPMSIESGDRVYMYQMVPCDEARSGVGATQSWVDSVF